MKEPSKVISNIDGRIVQPEKKKIKKREHESNNARFEDGLRLKKMFIKIDGPSIRTK